MRSNKEKKAEIAAQRAVIRQKTPRQKNRKRDRRYVAGKAEEGDGAVESRLKQRTESRKHM
jgi:hypothetical protein